MKTKADILSEAISEAKGDGDDFWDVAGGVQVAIDALNRGARKSPGVAKIQKEVMGHLQAAHDVAAKAARELDKK